MPDGTPPTLRTEYVAALAADAAPRDGRRTEPGRYVAAGDYWFHQTGSMRAEGPGRGSPAAVCRP
ncbi:hypothetical protein AB0B01_15525 [Streptomyces sp. NPDC044571]|uniref:hypothetical protein n=1 Tax=Streptomyces sp. NPDC044571 TaxID=3155371 RepID=UPI0033CF83C8